MSEKRWHEALRHKMARQKMAGLKCANGRPRVAVMGIGHELRGDDAAGVVLARLLNQRHGGAGFLAVEAGPAPENCFGPLLDYRPDLVLFVDAAQMGAEPGAIRLLDWKLVKAADEVQLNASTHTLPLPTLAEFLATELGCPVWLLGIQPAQTAVSTSLSAPVCQAVEKAAALLADLLALPQGVAGI
ncbi:MAG: hydrogenase 3 maturation endopeptidase HyCI [Chloroflexota bacterium]|jgi:hydrogenase 3 maturation protease